MSDGIAISNKLADDLIKSLGLPEKCIEVTLRFAAGKPVRVECIYYPAADGVQRLMTRLAEFELVPKQKND